MPLIGCLAVPFGCYPITLLHTQAMFKVKSKIVLGIHVA